MHNIDDSIVTYNQTKKKMKIKEYREKLPNNTQLSGLNVTSAIRNIQMMSTTHGG